MQADEHLFILADAYAALLRIPISDDDREAELIRTNAVQRIATLRTGVKCSLCDEWEVDRDDPSCTCVCHFGLTPPEASS